MTTCIPHCVRQIIARLDGVSPSVNGLICRLAAATTFWRSGQTKVHGFFQINDSTFDLFRDEYRVPLIPPDIAAVMATINEHLFAALLVVGLASRLSAAALFGMTMTIQIFVYPENWPDHLLWSAALLYVVFRGPGKWSLDHVLEKHLFSPAKGPLAF